MKAKKLCSEENYPFTNQHQLYVEWQILITTQLPCTSAYRAETHYVLTWHRLQARHLAPSGVQNLVWHRIPTMVWYPKHRKAFQAWRGIPSG